LELSSWFAEYNQLVFMIICAVAMVYWVKQLKIFEDNGEETTTALFQ
jgi:hypothetical protein